MEGKGITAWLLAFLAFPLGGWTGYFVGEKLEGVASILISALIAGFIIGLVQYLALRTVLTISWLWVPGTAFALTAAAFINYHVFGFDIDYVPLLTQGLIAGLLVGAVQWVAARTALPVWWILTVMIGWPLGWLVTKNVGVDLTEHWAVFGASGGVVYQLITGITLLLLVKNGSTDHRHSL